MRVYYPECTGCVSDPFRSTYTNNCRCDYGYYYNG